MNKKKLIEKQVVIWTKTFPSIKGRTGKIDTKYGAFYNVILDGSENSDSWNLYESELYFQDHPLGFNQPCFQ